MGASDSAVSAGKLTGFIGVGVPAVVVHPRMTTRSSQMRAINICLPAMVMVSLFFVGVYVPTVLDFMHFDFWQAAFIVLAICFWAIWVQWATRPRMEASAVSRSDPPPNTVV